MMTSLRPLMLCWMLALSLCTTACVADSSNTALRENTAPSLDQFPQSSLSIVAADGHEYPFTIWLADTEAHREQGLMFVPHLKTQTGMLFVFDYPQMVSMWMKNTLIPLDMLFIDTNGRVDSIIADATPLSLQMLRSEHAVLGVLEIAGGSAAKLGIKPGAVVKYPAFASVRGSR